MNSYSTVYCVAIIVYEYRRCAFASIKLFIYIAFFLFIIVHYLYVYVHVL